ncbi:MAG: hypothetical protein Q8R39_02580 [bacterium]|nr:hypothetical protein [bacterium]MDZ4284901.1 hypothetical protein [Patescibacteria group bacterium]
MFERNLIAGSGKENLQDAAPFWELHHVGVVASGKRENCQLCHTPLLKFAVIRNHETDIRKLIGFDCYAKLLRYLETHHITSSRLRKLDEHEREQREYVKRHINASMLAWLRSQSDLPDHARLSLEVIDTLGYPPSLVAAELLVGYYRTHRHFSLENTELVANETRALLRRYPDRGSLPQRVNFNGLSQIEAMLEVWGKADKAQREQDDIEARLEIIAPKDGGRVITPRYTGFLAHPAVESVYKRLNVSVVLDNERHDFAVELWKEHPLEQRVTDVRSRELLASCASLYGTSLEGTMPPTFRVVRGPNGTIRVADRDLEAWADRAEKELVRLIDLEFRNIAKARVRRESKYGLEFIATHRVALRNRLRQERWMVVQWTGALCGDHWDECLPLLQKRYGEKRGNEIYDMSILASREISAEYLLHNIVAGYSTRCVCYTLTKKSARCEREFKILSDSDNHDNQHEA